MRTCCILGCLRPHLTKGLCNTHRMRLRRKDKPEEAKISYKKWAKAHKDDHYPRLAEWRKKNPAKVLAANARRRASRIKATPQWVCSEDLLKVYESCPKGFHVDHIIPLQGSSVCGLHVPWNLQHLPASDNIKKGNRLV